MGPPRKRRKITSTTRDIESRNDSEQLSELNPVTVPDSVSPNTNQIRANQTVLSNNSNNDNQSSTLLNIDYARLAREIVRLQAGPTSTNVTAPIHSVLSTTTGNSIDHRDINLLPPLLTVPYVNENSQPSATSEASRTIPMQSTSVLPGNNCSTDSNVNFHNLIDSILSNEPSANVHNNYNAGQRQVTELTSGIPLGAHIPKRIKEKIWANEYIDLSALLPTNVDNDLWSVTFAPNTVTLQNQQNVPKPKSILSFYEWNEAFRIYMAIYIQIFPEDAPHMLKYMSTIKNIYEMKGNESFRYYDETFRLLRKENSQPWQQEIDELYRKAMFMKSSKFTVNHNFPQPPTTAKYNNGTAINPNNRRVQPFLDTNNNGTCHIYNKYQCCTKRNYPYQHVCRVCKGPHPQAKCTKQATIHQINQPHTKQNVTKPSKP